MTDIYQCEKCKKIFDEFEMNYKEAQKDKKCLCRECREKDHNEEWKNARDAYSGKREEK